MGVGDLIKRLDFLSNDPAIITVLECVKKKSLLSMKANTTLADLIRKLRLVITRSKSHSAKLEKYFQYELNSSIYSILTINQFEEFIARLESRRETAFLCAYEETEYASMLEDIKKLDAVSLEFETALLTARNSYVAHSDIHGDNNTKLIHFIVFFRLLEDFQQRDTLEWASIHGLKIDNMLSDTVIKSLLYFRRYNTTKLSQRHGSVSTLDLCANIYQRQSYKQDIVDIMTLIAEKNEDEDVTFEALHKITVVDFKEIDSKDLDHIGKGLVSSSLHPISMSLKVASLFKELSEINLSHRTSLLVQYESFTQTVINLVDDFPSDQIALMFLEERDNNGNSAISIAVSSENAAFMSHPRITRIFDHMWSVSDFMMTESLGSSTRLTLFLLLLRNPFAFFRLPRGKFFVRALNYVFFVMFFSYTVSFKSDGLHSDFFPWELLTYWQAAAFLLSEVDEFKNSGPDYFKSDWNKIDIMIYTGFIGLVFARISALIHPEFPHGGPAHDPNWAIFFDMCVFCVTVLLWVRLLYIFIAHPTLGPLQRTIFSMIHDIRNFFFIMVIFWTGFSLAFWFLLASEDDIIGRFNNFNSSLLAMFLAMVGDFDVKIFFVIEDVTLKRFCIALYCVYLILSLIVLLNLLVAMMSDTYSDVQNDSVSAFLLGKSTLVYEYDEIEHSLPPPFSNLVWLIAFPIYTYQVFKTVKLEKTNPPSGALPLQPEDEEAGLAELVSRQMDHADIEVFRPLLKQRHYVSLLEETKNFIPWVCQLCYHKNTEPSFLNVLKYLINRDPTTSKMSIVLLSPNYRMCNNCNRIRRPASHFNIVSMEVSYILFLVFLWLPLIVILAIPSTFENAKFALKARWANHRASLNDMFHFDHLMKLKHAKKIGKRGSSETSFARQHWVANNFVDGHVTDIPGHISVIKGKITTARNILEGKHISMDRMNSDLAHYASSGALGEGELERLMSTHGSTMDLLGNSLVREESMGLVDLMHDIGSDLARLSRERRFGALDEGTELNLDSDYE